MVHPVADLAGLNRLTRTALTNAALALAGMILMAMGMPGAAAVTRCCGQFGPWWRLVDSLPVESKADAPTTLPKAMPWPLD